MLVAGKVGVGVRHISIENGGRFHLYPFEAHQENALVTGQVGDIVEGAPLPGIDDTTKRLLGQVAREFADGLVLMFEADEC